MKEIPFKYINLIENNYYVVWKFWNHKEIYLFKKVTDKGYNFLNPFTNKYLFKTHMYLNKKNNMFAVGRNIYISDNLNDANTKNSILVMRMIKIKKVLKNFVD